MKFRVSPIHHHLDQKNGSQLFQFMEEAT